MAPEFEGLASEFEVEVEVAQGQMSLHQQSRAEAAVDQRDAVDEVSELVEHIVEVEGVVAVELVPFPTAQTLHRHPTHWSAD